MAQENTRKYLESKIAELEVQFRGIELFPEVLAGFSSGSCTNNCTGACTIGCTSGCTNGCIADPAFRISQPG